MPGWKQRMRTGFTLVEIMIVIAIIGILLAVALPQFFRAREGANARACVNNLKQILSAKERWAMDNSRGATDTPTMADLAGTGRYIKLTPACPSAGTYTVNDLGTPPTCSIGGTPGEWNAHALP